MQRTVTGRISRRGIFTASSGEAAKVVFGKAWRSGKAGHELVRVTVQLGQRHFAGTVQPKADQVTLIRQF